MQLDDELDQLINDQNAPAAPAAPAAPTATQPVDFMKALEVDDAVDAVQTVADPAAPASVAASVTTSATTLDVAALTEMARSNAALAAQIAAARETPAAPVVARPLFDASELDLTPEEQETYRQSQGIISRIANQAVKNYHERAIAPLQTQIEQMNARTTEAERVASASNEGAFLAQMHAAVPQLAKLAKTPEWQAFLNKPAPMTGGKATIAQMLGHNVQQKNLEAIVEIVSGFQGPAVVTGHSVAPGRAQPTTPLKTPGQRPKTFAYSKFADLSERVRTGLAPYSELQRVEAEMFQAEADGRVDYNA